MDKDFLDNHPALQVIRETVEDNADEENEEVQVERKFDQWKHLYVHINHYDIKLNFNWIINLHYCRFSLNMIYLMNVLVRAFITDGTLRPVIV